MRFCSALNIAASAADEAVIDAFLEYRRCTTSLAADVARKRLRLWRAGSVTWELGMRSMDPWACQERALAARGIALALGR